MGWLPLCGQSRYVVMINDVQAGGQGGERVRWVGAGKKAAKEDPLC
jgi:hypothetical protein